jgi:predicted nucleic acid-binding protein
MADARAVAAAVEAGGSVIVTADTSDLERLAASYPNVHITAI